jgi:catechol 2,3-dioxygenase-like lactoylglutathione lyase family enzyme
VCSNIAVAVGAGRAASKEPSAGSSADATDPGDRSPNRRTERTIPEFLSVLGGDVTKRTTKYRAAHREDMSETPFAVEGIDHVELVVPDRYEAAGWYERTLGLSIAREYELWAEEGGPLVISGDDGTTKLALFEGDPRTAPTPRRVAFRVDGAGFRRFLDRLEELELADAHGERVTRTDVADHDVSFSIYFHDPYGTPLEVTTYEYDEVEEALKS